MQNYGKLITYSGERRKDLTEGRESLEFGRDLVHIREMKYFSKEQEKLGAKARYNNGKK